ncbi:MAG: hypothetical protein H8D75_01515 [Rhodospirillaceae bacterium]|nr:hypothetical protein [Rhodospirillaceae bacterium]
MKLKRSSLSLIFLVTSVLAFFLILSPVATHADEWLEQDPGQWINWDSPWVDRQTNIIVLEVASDKGDGTFMYGLIGIDCENWRIHQLTSFTDERSFAVYSGWRSNANLIAPVEQGSGADQTANRLCTNRNTLAHDDLPQ